MRIAVVGAGVIGLATTASLGKKHDDVTCFERATRIMDERSSGDTRIFRLAHPEAALVELAARALRGYESWASVINKPLLRKVGCVISGQNVTIWADAMAQAGQEHLVTDGCSQFTLPARRRPIQVLYDPLGGVIHTNAVRDCLQKLAGAHIVHEHVYALEHRGRAVDLWSSHRRYSFDRVIIAAGAGTSALAAQVGIYTPTALSHHVRFSFRMLRPTLCSSWIDKPATGLSTYQHQSGTDMWAVGGHLDDEATAWEAGRAEVYAKSATAVLEYVEENLDLVPEIVSSLYCSVIPGLGDGFRIRSSGAVSAIYGENLFKLAPAVGELIADAISRDGQPEDWSPL